MTTPEKRGRGRPRYEPNDENGRQVEMLAGSGSTIIACEITGSKAYAIELNPAYVDVTVKRWQEFTGKDAIHEATGKTYNDLVANR